MKQKHPDLLGPLLDDLIRHKSDPGEIHLCPYCNGNLKVSIRIYISPPVMIGGKPSKSMWDKYLGAGTWCENCSATLFAQYSFDVAPSWARESEYNNMSIDEIMKLMRSSKK